LDGETDFLANAANTAALVYHILPEVNWVGFYFFKGGQLVVGPFQGKPACTRIALGKGVCGTAAAQRKSLVVPNVHDFPGHIACDSASASEIVVPIVADGRLIGVFDVDSPVTGRFDAEDRVGLESVVRAFLEAFGDKLPVGGVFCD
jgi:GAF domain-containing protein